MNGRSYLYIAIALAACPISYAAAQYANPAEAYVESLDGSTQSRGIKGPDQVTYVRSSGARQVSVSSLRALLADCRRAMIVSSGSATGWTATQTFECVQPGAADRVIAVKASGTSSIPVQAVQVMFGGRLVWPGPAPSGAAWRQFDAGLFAQYKRRVEGVVSAFANGRAPIPALPQNVHLKLYSDTQTGADLSPSGLGAVLRSCVPISTVAASVPERKGVMREGVKTMVKCDRRSSAPADIAVYATFTDGEIDGLLASTVYNYRIAQSGMGGRK